MRELRTLKRTRSGSRVRSVQGRLSIEFGDEDATGGDQLKVEPPVRSSGFRRPTKSFAENRERSPAARTAAPVFHPLAYRSVVAVWPLEWREHWGRRANELEETGLSCAMRKPKPLSRSGTSIVVLRKRVRLRRCLLTSKVKTPSWPCRLVGRSINSQLSLPRQRYARARSHSFVLALLKLHDDEGCGSRVSKP